MAKKNVLLIGNPVLRKKSLNIKDFGSGLKGIMRDLEDTLTHLQKTKRIGRALAAPQIGHLKKVVFFRLPEESFVMVNPEIVQKSREMFGVWDSCFSFDVAFFVNVKRHKEIKVEYHDDGGNPREEVFVGRMSELVQHETDHLSGILATDHLKDLGKIMMREEWEKRYGQDIIHS